MRIAVVDDEAQYLNKFRTVLESVGHEVVCFHRASEAIDAVSDAHRVNNNESFGIALVDINLRPDRYGGFSVVSRLRERDVHIPIIITTNFHDPDEISQLTKTVFTGGMVDFAHKSELSDQVLIDMVKNMIEVSEMQKNGERALGSGLWHVDPAAGPVIVQPGMIIWDEMPVNLALCQVRLVGRLLQSVGDVVSYEELFQLVPTGRTNDNIIRHLKGAQDRFTAVDSRFDRLMMVPFRGWQWIAR